MTLAEIFKTHTIPLKVKRLCWGMMGYVNIVATSSKGAVGFDEYGAPWGFTLSEHRDFEVYIEPKKKKFLYLWAYKTGCGWLPTQCFYELTEEAQRGCGTTNVTRIDATKIEVEV